MAGDATYVMVNYPEGSQKFIDMKHCLSNSFSARLQICEPPHTHLGFLLVSLSNSHKIGPTHDTLKWVF